MSMRYFLVNGPLTHKIRATSVMLPKLRSLAPKNHLHTAPRFDLNQHTIGVRLSRFSSSSAAHSKKATASSPWGLYRVAGTVGLGLALAVSTYPAQPIYCEAPRTEAQNSAPLPLPPLPQSAVNVYELTFGTACGICAGIFVKKGAKIAGFVFGGVFVLLQYFASLSLVRVDWSRMATRFENVFYTVDAQGAKRPPNVASLLRLFVNFLTADFQQRASFIAGFALGLRLG